MLADIRREYHRVICSDVLRVINGVVNIADTSNRSSREISLLLVKQLGYPLNSDRIAGQFAGNQFEHITKNYLEESFGLLSHLRPGQWEFNISTSISRFAQYKHLEYIQTLLSENPMLASALGGDYLITPDIVVGKSPILDNDINAIQPVILENDNIGLYTPFRGENQPNQILHASISCKWTIRSDRSQNSRTEALNLIRNRKGRTPLIAAVTAEPLPTRLASLALGTGDLDCLYHFALNELIEAVEMSNNDSQQDMLKTLIDGNRLRDISDLPFDLAI